MDERKKREGRGVVGRNITRPGIKDTDTKQNSEKEKKGEKMRAKCFIEAPEEEQR